MKIMDDLDDSKNRKTSSILARDQNNVNNNNNDGDEIETVRNSIIKNLNMNDNNQLKEISEEAIK
jgi:hypothetical protein